MARPWWQRLALRIPTLRREVKEQDRRVERTEAIRQRNIALRIRAEDVIAGYRKAGRAIGR